MPKFLENKLKAEYGKNSKVPYKVMNSMGVMHGNKETAKGEAMDRKHRMDADISKFKGEEASHSFRRVARKVIRHSA